jgi:hypothetical protein
MMVWTSRRTPLAVAHGSGLEDGGASGMAGDPPPLIVWLEGSRARLLVGVPA